MTTIHAITTDQLLSATVLPKVACNNQNTVRLHVTFDSAWDGYNKTAIFYTSKNPTPYEVIFSTDNIAIVPPEVLTEEAHLYIGVKGVNGSKIKMSTVLRYKLSVGTPSVVISDPTADVYHQLLNLYRVERARINSIAKLEEGSTTGDAELADIRIAASGKTFANAGDSVRTQFLEITNRKMDSSDFVEQTDEERSQIGDNLLDGVEWSELGYYCDEQGDKVSTQYTTNYRCSNVIPINPNRRYKWSGNCSHLIAMFFSDTKDDGEPITLSGLGTNEFVVPNGKTHVAFNVIGEVVESLYQFEYSFIIPRLLFEHYVDDTLTEQGKAADAKAVGDRLAELTIPFEAISDHAFEAVTNEIAETTWSELGYYRTKEGDVVQNEYTANYIASDFIPVIPNYKYKLYSDGAQSVSLMFYTDAKNDGTEQSIYIDSVGEFTVPDGRTYVALNMMYNVATEMHRTTQNLNERTIVIPNLKTAGNNVGYRIVNFGDSIFGNFQDETSISSQLAEFTGATVHNCAFGGCQMTDRTDAEWKPFSMCNLADAVASGDYTAQKAQLGNGVPDYFAAHVARLESIDFSKVDVVTIAYGTNDFAASDIIAGDNPTDKNTVQGALRYAIQTIGTAYPNIRFLICTPMWRCVFTADGKFDYGSDTWRNGIGKKLANYADAIKQVAKEYHIPVCDYYEEMALNRYNWQIFYTTSDGVHPIPYGRKLMAKKLSEKLSCM